MPNPTPRAELERFDYFIRVDDRAGSSELVYPLNAIGVPAREERLEVGDVEIIGADGTVVGVEYKKWPDVLACVRNGRFAEQLRGMKRAYHVCWLLIEGRIRAGAMQKIEVMHNGAWREADGGYTYQEVASWLATMAQCGGALLWRTEDQLETLAWIRAQYHWWTFQQWEEHRAHKAWFTPPLLWEMPYSEPPLALKLATTLPGVGPERAAAILDVMGNDKEYPSALEVLEAGTVALERVPGIGKVVARRVWDSVRARERRITKRTRVAKDAKAKGRR